MAGAARKCTAMSGVFYGWVDEGLPLWVNPSSRLSRGAIRSRRFAMSLGRFHKNARISIPTVKAARSRTSLVMASTLFDDLALTNRSLYRTSQKFNWLCGGDKGSQKRDTERAAQLAKDWRQK